MASTFSPTKQVNRVAWLTLSSAQQTLLKWLAIFFMLLDHANRTLWTFQPWLFTVGRLVFPLSDRLQHRCSWRKPKALRPAAPALRRDLASSRNPRARP